MSSSSNKTAEQTARDEHNIAALSKRVLNVGFDYDKGEYGVAGVDENGNATVKEEKALDIHERLKEIELLLRKLVFHAELVTSNIVKEEDL